MRCLYIGPDGERGLVDDPRLEATTERHKLELSIAPCDAGGDPVTELARDPSLAGLIIDPGVGWMSRRRLRLASRVLGLGRRVWLYWPREAVVECVDRERLASHRRHWAIITGAFALRRAAGLLARVLYRVAAAPYRLATVLYRVAARLPQPPGYVAPVLPGVEPRPPRSRPPHDLDALAAAARPVPFSPGQPAPDRPIRGCGVYLRTDFWARIESGGSYGHTCYVARELAAVTERLVCLMAHRYPLLDEYGVEQVVLPPPPGPDSEETIVGATAHYLLALRPACEALRPAYIYERLCLGNYAGALLSRELGIPYLVEYNGSEISMRRSFDGVGYAYEREYLQAEALAFRQATMISVVSEEVKASLVARGVDAEKILVNPNGADLAAYAPAESAEKAAIRTELGLDPERPVVGFTGTFGGWHGIDVLAAALPRICARRPDVQFLLIGDGNYKHLIDHAVREHRLGDRVRAVGRVPQAEGARLLKACDLYVSPHSSHMVDSRFFGSPTKIFEYMAMAGGIVASDLEQIGQVLSLALRPTDLRDPDVAAGEARAVLCRPGDVDEFVEGVVGLLARPDLWPVLGRNARRAVEQHYSWSRHVARLWAFLAGEAEADGPADLRKHAPRAAGARASVESEVQPGTVASIAAAIEVPAAGGGIAIEATPGAAPAANEDPYKEEVQRQWDHDPAGSHYVRRARPHTREWFEEVEAYRYGEYAPWMRELMEFDRHAGEDLLEIGGGLGTDLAQFARHGARTTDLDLSLGHLRLAEENFRLRGLRGRFVHHDAERLPFDDETFDVVYSNGVIHHTPNTRAVVREIRRVLRPGGKAIVMVYAEHSLHYWRNLVWAIGIKEEALRTYSMGEIMSRSVERSDNAGARPLVKVYTPRRLRSLFEGFEDIRIYQRQMVPAEKPRLLAWVPREALERAMGWNLVVKARKPAAGGAR